MKTVTIIKHTLFLTLGTLLSVPDVLCQQKENQDGAPAVVELGHGYVRKDGAIHFTGGGTTGTGANATRIDMPSPQLLKKAVDSQFGPFKTAEGLDAASFEALSEEYSRDKNRVYHKVISPGEFLVILLPDADPKSFEVLARNVARDKNHVWLYERIQPGVDPATVEIVNRDFSVLKDRDSVHYQSEEIAGADPASFRHIGSAYYADSKRVYWGGEPIPDADPATFKVLGESFIAKDKATVYRSGEPLTGYDADSLELILHNPMGYQVVSDKNGIHVNKMTFPRSKPGHVEVIDDRTVKAGDLVLLVETSRSLPVTVFREDGKLMAETPAYEFTSGQVQGMITAEVTAAGLKDIRISPLPGGKEAPTVPDWRMEVFDNPDYVQRYLEAGKRIK